MFCSKCGCALDENSNFCGKCGTPCENVFDENNNPNTIISHDSHNEDKGLQKNTNKGIIILIAGIIGCVLLLICVFLEIGKGTSNSREEESTMDVSMSREEESTMDVSMSREEESTMDVSMFDSVLYNDGKYIIGMKEYETYNSYYVNVGIVDNAGNWIVPLSQDFIFSKAFMEIEAVHEDVSPSSKNIIYLGDGVFIMSYGVDIITSNGSHTRLGSIFPSENTCYLYNVDTGCSASFEAVDLSYCIDGNMLMYNSTRYNSNFFKVDMNGKVTEIPVENDSWYDGPSHSGYSDGVFFANGYFYDIDGNVVCSLLEYDLISTPYFSNGLCEIRFKNPKGTVYTKVIDKNGRFVD